MTTLTTDRLRLEPFGTQHLEPLAILNADPLVMRYITGKPMTPEQNLAMLDRVTRHWAEFGCSWWAFMARESGTLMGAGCIQHLGHVADGPLEIGWRLKPACWHQGYASEAARAMAGFAFNDLGAPELLAVCHPDNAASASVMQRLGMTLRGIERWYDMDTTVYRITRAQFLDRLKTLP